MWNAHKNIDIERMTLTWYRYSISEVDALDSAASDLDMYNDIADFAMYQWLSSARNTWLFFCPNLQDYNSKGKFIHVLYIFMS